MSVVFPESVFAHSFLSHKVARTLKNKTMKLLTMIMRKCSLSVTHLAPFWRLFWRLESLTICLFPGVREAREILENDGHSSSKSMIQMYKSIISQIRQN